MLAFVRGDVPFVSIRQVFEHDLWNIEFLLFFPSVASRVERQRSEKQQQQKRYISYFFHYNTLLLYSRYVPDLHLSFEKNVAWCTNIVA